MRDIFTGMAIQAGINAVYGFIWTNSISISAGQQLVVCFLYIILILVLSKFSKNDS